MVNYNKAGGGGGNSVWVHFPSVKKRNDVHDAIKGRAAAINQNNEELRCLFDLAQPIGHAEKNENPQSPQLDIEFETRQAGSLKRCGQYLKRTNDPDLQWLGQKLDP